MVTTVMVKTVNFFLQGLVVSLIDVEARVTTLPDYLNTGPLCSFNHKIPSTRTRYRYLYWSLSVVSAVVAKPAASAVVVVVGLVD